MHACVFWTCMMHAIQSYRGSIAVQLIYTYLRCLSDRSNLGLILEQCAGMIPAMDAVNERLCYSFLLQRNVVYDWLSPLPEWSLSVWQVS